METKYIVCSISQGVFTLALNTPDNLNALCGPMYTEITAALKLAAQDESVRAVVICGKGRAFSGGGDIGEMQRQLQENRLELDVLAGQSPPIVKAIMQMPKPVLAAVHGAVAGAALSIVLACDIVLAADDTMFFVPFVNIGLVPDAGGLYMLSRAVGKNRAVALAMLGGKISAEEAFNWGFVHSKMPKDELEETTNAIATKLAKGPTKAYAGLKELAYQSQFAGTSFEEYIPQEIKMQTSMGNTSDFAQGVAAFLEKRKANFKGQ